MPRWVYVLAGGIITTLLALRPLGWIRVLRKYVTAAVIISLIYLGVQLLRHPLPSLGAGNWNGFWIAVDTVIGVSLSWVPLISDYSRHARSTRSAFAGAFVGYTVTQIACYGLVVGPLAWALAIGVGWGFIGIVWAVIGVSLAAAFLQTWRFWLLSRV